MIINDDGSIFHLHLRPDQLTDNIILVGDPARVELVASFSTLAISMCSHESSEPSAARIKGNPSCV